MNWRDRIEKNSPRERASLLWAAVIALLVVILDQWTKWYFIRNYKMGVPTPIIPGVLNFTYVENIGAAWSMLSGQVWLLLLFGITAGAAIIYFFRKLAEGCVERYYALLLVISGIIGNSFDRAFHGAVIDFIHVHYYESWHYPVFNVADMAICIGVFIYLISGFCRKSPEAEK